MIKNIIVIGASAGGLEPLQKLVENLPDKLPQTAVVIAQHTSPKYESLLASLLNKRTNLTVRPAEEGQVIEEHQIYTCPPDSNVLFSDGKFRFENTDQNKPSPSVDKLFTSASENYGKGTIAVVLSGTGNDGSSGISDVKKSGGLAIAQNPDTASYAGMPDSSIFTELIDIILPAENIGRELGNLLDYEYRQSVLKKSKKSQEKLPEDEKVAVTSVLKLLKKKTGTDFSGYKKSTIYRRLEKRMSDRKFDSIEDYTKYVQQDEDELEHLLAYLLIGVTYFFRDIKSMVALTKHIQKSLNDLSPGEEFRVWVPGCASGEEVYTLSMIILDLLEKGCRRPEKIQIFATDISQTSLDTARSGVYSKDSVKHVPEEYIAKYFTVSEENYMIKPEVKKLILFSRHDLLASPPFLRLNMISCRNLLIYFSAALQNQVIPLFHYTLRGDGILFLGKSENIGRHSNLFESLDSSNKIFKKRLVDTNVSRVPVLKAYARKQTINKSQNTAGIELTVADLVKETLYNGYEHPYIVIDNELNIVEMNKDLSNYISLPSGSPHYNASKLIHTAFKLDLRTLKQKAHENSKTEYGYFRTIEKNGISFRVRIKVQPTLFSKPTSPFFIVTFEEREIETGADDVAVAETNQSKMMVELEHELATTKEHLSTTVDELENSNEELQSLNEELQSSNEELQASNEELETSNEELQATIEELNVAYAEITSTTAKLEQQTEKLELSESNLMSMMNNSIQSFILINNQLEVSSFNDLARTVFKELFNIRITEGASFMKLIPSEHHEFFKTNINLAFGGEKLILEQTVDTNVGISKHFSFNFIPVIKKTSAVDMVNLSFVDITERILYQNQLRNERSFWVDVFTSLPSLNAILIADTLEIQHANDAFVKLYPANRNGKTLITEIIPELNTRKFRKITEHVRDTGAKGSLQEIKLVHRKGSREVVRYYDFTLGKSTDYQNGHDLLVLNATDVTSELNKRHRAEEEKDFMDMVANTLPQQVWVVLPDRSIEFVNRGTLDFFKKRSIIHFSDLINSITEDCQHDLESKLNVLFTKGEVQNLDCKFIDGSHREIWYSILMSAVIKEGEVKKVIVSATDINDHMIIQKNKDEFMGVASHELKTPLTSVKAYIELLKDYLDNNNDPTVTEYLDRTGKGVLKLDKFISDILDISRIQQGSLTLNKTSQSMATLLKEVVGNLQIIHNQNNIRLNIGLGDYTISADFDRIEQVIVNLINNAIKYSPGKEEIEVTLGQNFDHIILSVKDFGMGIPKEDHKRVFKRFYRNKLGASFAPGLGIGLNISKEIIDLHNGRIWVESKVGAGSIFSFTLPIKDHEGS